MFRGRHRSFRRAAWLALLALALQTLVPALHRPAAAAAPGFDAANMCIAPGNQAPTSGNTDKAPAHGQPCAICLTLHMLASGFAPPHAVVLPLPIAVAAAVPLPSVSPFHGRVLVDARARAPPASA